MFSDLHELTDEEHAKLRDDYVGSPKPWKWLVRPMTFTDEELMGEKLCSN